jgi:hypothetical protein
MMKGSEQNYGACYPVSHRKLLQYGTRCKKLARE